MFGETYEETLQLASYTFSLLDSLGLKVHPTKGHFLPVLVGEHLGMTLDFEKGEFRAPIAKLENIAVLAKMLLCSAAAHKRWVRVKALVSLAGKAQVLYLAIPVARFFLRELHDVVKNTKTWSGTVRVACQLKRDVE